MEEGQKMGGDGFTPGTQRFAFGLFFCCLALLTPQIMKAFQDPEPEPARVPFNGVAVTYDAESHPTVCEGDIGSSDLVAYLHQRQWKHPNPAKDANCAKSVKITEQESGKEKSIVARVVGKCVKNCKVPDLALSSSAFKKLFKDAKGPSFKVTWDYTE